MPSTPARTDGRRLTVRPYHCRPRTRRPSSGQRRTHSSFALIRVRGGGSHSCRPCSAPRRGGGSGHGCPPWPPYCSCSPLSPGRRSPMTGRAGCGTPSSRRVSPGPRRRSGSRLSTSTGAAQPRSTSRWRSTAGPGRWSRRGWVVGTVAACGSWLRAGCRSASIASRSPPGPPTGRASVCRRVSSGWSRGARRAAAREPRAVARRAEPSRGPARVRVARIAGDAAGTESGSASATGAAAGSGHPGGSDPSGGGSTDRGPAAPATPTGSGSAGGSGASGTSDGSGDAAPADASTASLKSPSNQASPADGSPVEPPGLRGERADAPPSAAEPAGPQPASSVDSAAGMGLPGVHPGAGPAGVPARDPDGGGTTAGGSGSRAAGAPDARDLLGAGGLPTELFRSTTILVTTERTAVVWAAFVIFGQAAARRRAARRPTQCSPPRRGRPVEPIRAAEPRPARRAGCRFRPGVDPNEAGLPRWRRPSLLQARKIDPLRTAVTAVSLTFADGPVDARRGLERRRIRYRLVTPDGRPGRGPRERDRDPRPGRRGPDRRRPWHVPARPLPGRPAGLAPQDGPRRASSGTEPTTPPPTGSTRTSWPRSSPRARSRPDRAAVASDAARTTAPAGE